MSQVVRVGQASTAAGLGPVAELHTLRCGQRLADTWHSLEEQRTGSLLGCTKLQQPTAH